jgi:hypothetical protein
MGTWSSKPATDLQCDFSIMVSKAMFDEFFLRPLEDQTRMVARTIYHLDGPGAARHLDSLLAMENLSGIQWVPGAGAKPMSEWIDLLQAIQAGGKLLWISCQPSEVEKLLKALKPEGLMLSTHCARPEEIDEVLRMVEKLSRKK